MFSWIYGMWQSVFGRITDTIRNWVTDLVNGVYGFFHFINGLIRGAWFNLANAAFWFVRNFESFAYWTYAKLWQLIRATVPAIINEYRRLVGAAENFIQSVLNQAAQWFNTALHYAENLTAGVLKWVIANVWDPLYKLATSLFDWIANKGETLWYYITHPDALAELLFDALVGILEREAWAIADRLGKFFLSLIVKNLRQVVTLVEDILDAIL